MEKLISEIGRFTNLLSLTIRQSSKDLLACKTVVTHIFMPLIESNKFNKGAKKVYLGVPGNLVAFACKFSFDKGYDGYVSFESKNKLIAHYQKSLGAHILFGNIVAIDTKAGNKLIQQYFPENL